MSSFDVIVIGAGPAGSTAALLLARAGWAVAIVEKAQFPRPKVCGEFVSASALSLLEEVGAADAVAVRAGPEIREVGFYAGERVITAELPPYAGPFRFGRALGREHLDAVLLEAAQRAGAQVWQPWRVNRIVRCGTALVCEAENRQAGTSAELCAQYVIRAHGSWDTGRLSVPGIATRRTASDLLAFKTHFRGAALSRTQMPLLAFPGGYSGFVHTDGARLSASCCVRRDVLAACRRESPDASAGAAVWQRVLHSCRGAREALEGAAQQEEWMAAGPLRPGMRPAATDHTLAIGNAMGEAQPSVAEGITLGIQSAWVLAGILLGFPKRPDEADRDALVRRYASAYRRRFASRIYWSGALGRLTMNPQAARAAAAIMARAPGLLRLGAAWSGKACSVGR